MTSTISAYMSSNSGIPNSNERAKRSAVASYTIAILLVQDHRSDAALDGAGAQLDAPVVQEAAKPVPMAQCVADSLGETVSAADLAGPHFEVAAQVADKRAAALLPCGTACIGRLPRTSASTA